MNREHVSVSKLESTLVRLMAVSCVLLMIQPCFAAWRSPDFNDWAEFGTGATIPVA